ncbi:PP2C family protein-serine/threonine phosphatase [Nitrospira defluvii]|uniref:Response regulator receiver modulated Serine phosphatase n=1 Tax=Nitrospira defluvii TaxID=330214 RepID=A0ABN7LZY1_9BACT|nr:SpoIIE family protein phosphatase [Nitrospira defluvii]MBA5875036.1 SpoIIE family protein phosphatase [Nitrospira sp. CR1.2]CAE6775941.1 Putative Response regulator receiver modulated Serine phosphatase [Nitrospira defluvii]
MGEPAPQMTQPAGVGPAAKPTPVILLVDDDEITRIGMAGRLKRLGYRVIEAVDGSAGLTAIRAHRPDLVILDWMMPGMDGPSVCEAIRADPELRSSQVVLMTAHDRPEQIAEGLSRGADDFLSKAASKQEVLARVHASLRSSALVREIERTRDDLDRSHKLLSAKQHELESELQSAAAFVRAQLPLPGMPAPGIAMHWAYQPSLALGGDLFQVCPWGPDALGLYILDASGHGVAAALRAVGLMSFLREDNLLKAVGSFDPGAIVNEANRRFPLTQDGEYFTLWVGRLDLESSRLSYATAGHGGAFVHANSGDSRWLASASLPLGFDPDSTFDSVSTQLQPLDRLYLLSDGIYEAPSSTGELWGRARLQATLEEHHASTLVHSITETMATAHHWLGGDIFPDDVALLGLEIQDRSTTHKGRA